MKKIIFLFILLFTISINAQNQSYYRLIEYVEKTPQSQTKDISTLSKYLAKGAKSKKELVQIIYYWISLNIDYDIELFENNTIDDVSAETTFLNRKSVCAGYANLFQEMCTISRIKCKVINGYGKGYNYNGEYLKEINHAWNAVKMYDKWEFIDVTWGAGGAFEDENGKLIFKKQLCVRYLFDSPEDFILDHFPENTEWQLLPKKITLDIFFSEEMERKRLERN
jgi:transglutaminase/protease-like cytokinesis protein 3